MSSLYRRATPQQRRLLRIVEGAVRNACHYHSDRLHIEPRFVRSIAKRTVGTLTAQWPEASAARAPSQQRGVGFLDGPRAVEGLVTDPTGPDRPVFERPEGRSAAGLHRASPLVRVRREIALRAGIARKAGLDARADQYIEILRLIALAQGRTVLEERFSTRAEPWEAPR